MNFSNKNYSLSAFGVKYNNKNYNIMSKTLKILILSIFILLTTSCEKEEEYPLDSGAYKSQKIKKQKPYFGPIFAKDTVSLKFEKMTNEDQMGKFSSNKMVEFNGKIWSVGGYQNGASYPNQSSEVWVSSNGSNWEFVTSGQFDSRVAHSLTVFDGKMWLIGGISNSESGLSDVWFSSDGFDWKLATNTPAFGSISFHSTTVFNNKLIVFTANEIWSSTDGIGWNLMAQNIFPARSGAELTVFNDKLYIIGGYACYETYFDEETGFDICYETYYNEIWESNNGTDWSQVSCSLPIFNGISSFSTSIYKKRCWIIGGWRAAAKGGSYASDEMWYSNNMKDWCKYGGSLELLQGGRSSHASIVYEDRVFVFGGNGLYGTTGSIWSFFKAN